MNHSRCQLLFCFFNHRAATILVLSILTLFVSTAMSTATGAESVEVLETLPVPVVQPPSDAPAKTPATPAPMSAEAQEAQATTDAQVVFFIEMESLLRLKKYQDMMPRLEAWIVLHPDDSRAHNMLIHSRIRHNEEQLRGVLKEESQLHDTLIDPEYLAAKTISTERTARHLDVVERLISLDKHADALRYLNEMLLADKNNLASLLMKDRLVASMLKIERGHLEHERRNQRERAINDIVKRGTMPDDKDSIPRVYHIFPEDLDKHDRQRLMLKLQVPLKGFNYKAAPLGKVLDHLFAIAGLNYIIYDQALGDETLTLSLQDETIESVLYTIQRMVGVRFNYHGGSVYVTSVDNPILVTEIVRLRSGLTDVLAAPSLVSSSGGGGSGDAGAAAGGSAPSAGSGDGEGLSDIERFLEKVPELIEWPDGSNIFLDKKSSTVMIRSAPATISEFKRLLTSIDFVSEQVLIETRFVEVRDSAVKNLGINWTLLSDSGNATNNIFGGISSGSTVNPLAANPGVLSTGLSAGTGFTAGIVGAGTGVAPNFATQISALEEKGDALTLSEPKILTLSNMTGVIDVRTDISYIGSIQNLALPAGTVRNDADGNNNTNTTEVNFAGVPQLETDYEGINLTVTPSVATNGEIITLKISPVVRELIRVRTVPFVVSGAGIEGLTVELPEFSTRQIATTLHIRNGETIVMGGLIKERDQNDRSGIPGLSRSRLIGGLFRDTKKSNTRSKLLIFVTATIIDPSGASYHQRVQHITNTANVVLPADVQEKRATHTQERREQQTVDIILDVLHPNRRAPKNKRTQGGRR